MRLCAKSTGSHLGGLYRAIEAEMRYPLASWRHSRSRPIWDRQQRPQPRLCAKSTGSHLGGLYRAIEVRDRPSSGERRQRHQPRLCAKSTGSHVPNLRERQEAHTGSRRGTPRRSFMLVVDKDESRMGGVATPPHPYAS